MPTSSLMVVPVATAIAACLAAPAMATAVVNYDEAVSGDIDTYTAAVDTLGQPTRTLIPLGTGHNTFTGTLASGGPQDSSDFIPFSLAANQTLTNLSVTVNDVVIISGSEIDLEDLFGNTFAHASLGNYSTGLNAGPGLYGLLLGNGVVVTGYQVGLDVSESIPNLPEPAAWALLIAGFGLTGAALRRKRAIPTLI